MNVHSLASAGSVINLNGPGVYKSWGIFYLSVANLVVIGIMVVLFGLALLLPFPGKHADVRDAGPGTMAGGPDWWHYNPAGHFFNSIHLWSVELFMAFLVIHLWGKFWMAAWRGRRAMTWITGVLAFILGILTSFTGFLMMTNWDSQWIAQQAKDAFNALGIGAIWNVMDAGQQFTMHVVVTTSLLLLVVTVHLGLVRRRGVCPPPGAEALETPDDPRYVQKSVR